MNPDQVCKILSILGWIPRNSEFAEKKLREVIDLMPDAIRSQIETGDPILITPRAGLWGIVSSETHNQLNIRLIDHHLDTLRSVAEKVVDDFPVVFHKETGRELGFDPEVAIRRFDSEIRIVVGQIEEQHTAGFRKYARTKRRREYGLTLLFLCLTGLAIGLSATIFKVEHGADWEYWRGYFDRGATAFLTAALTTMINLYFEFRTWRNDKRSINWGAAS